MGVRESVRVGRPVRLCTKHMYGRSREEGTQLKQANQVERAQVLEYIEEQRLSEWVEVDL